MLAGGLQLWIQQVDSPVASAQLWFKAGATDERPDEHGAAHFLEHLLFKGTARRGVGAAAGEIEGLGGDLNAWTTWDETCLHATVYAPRLDGALDVLFDMARHSVLDADELERERQVVLEEIRSYDDDPDSVATDHLQAMLFGDHAYGRPVLGTADSIQALKRDKVHAFWQRHHHPGRALLAIAGPVDPAEVERVVARLAEGWAVGEPRAPVTPTPPAAGRRVVSLDHDFGSVVAQLGWPGPALGHPDHPALDVLTAALGQGASSSLAVALDLEGGVASGTWADSTGWLAGGALTMGFQAGNEAEQALRLTAEVLADAHQRGLDAAAVARARDNILSDQLFAAETADGVAGELAWFSAHHGNPDARERYRAAVAAVTPADVARVARDWLDPSRLQAVMIDRELTQEAVVAALSPPERAARVCRPSERLGRNAPPDVHTLPSGMRVALLPDNGDLAAVRVLGLGGQRLETVRTAGLAQSWAWTATRGAGSRDAVAFAERADELSAVIEASAGRSISGFAASVPAHNLDGTLDLLGDLLLEPALDVVDWEHVREELLDDIPAREDRAGWKATHSLWRALWPGHPWRFPHGGTTASLNKISAGALRLHHRRVFAADNIVVAVAGGIDPDRVLEVMSGWDGALPQAARLPAPVDPKAPRTHIADQAAGKEQATVALGVRGLGLDHPDRTVLAMAAAVLDSQSGRLFLNLREARGLAYGVWASHDAAVGGGVFYAGMSTAPERAAEATDALRHELLQLTEHGPTDAELERTRQMLLGLSAMRSQRVMARASDLALLTRLGLPWGLPALEDRLNAVTGARTTEVLQRIGLHRAVGVTVHPR